MSTCDAVVAALDPLFAALAQTARTWYERLGSPVHLLHDTQAALTPARVQTTIHFLANPLPEFRRFAPPVPVTAINQVDSKDDPRVQVADLLAGLARRVATAALDGTDRAGATALRPFVDIWSLWSDSASWTDLTGRPEVGA